MDREGNIELKPGAPAVVSGLGESMNDFFANILNRNLGANEVVRPRPLARFEPESAGPVIRSAMDHTGISETGSDEPARQARLYRPTADKSGKPHFTALEKDNHLNTPLFQEHGKSYSPPKFAEQPSQKEEASKLVVDQRPKVIIKNPNPPDTDLPKCNADSKVEADEHAFERGYGIESKMLLRIKSILARLQNREKVQATGHLEKNNLNRSQRINPNLAAVSEKDRPVTQPTTAIASGPEKAGQGGADQEQQKVNAATDLEIPWSDQLEPPSWLSEMQTELHQRLNEPDRRSEPEPVINVTIGRVEVRAIQADTPKQPKKREKPSGVMSLDDYLLQRERRSST